MSGSVHLKMLFSEMDVDTLQKGKNRAEVVGREIQVKIAFLQ